MDLNRLKGIFTALITPFSHGRIDEKAYQSFIEWQVKEGVHGLVPCGTTGESPTLSYEEHNRAIDLCVEAAGGKVPVMAGTGANNTEEAIMFTRHAKEAGADAALIVTPYYNKPTQEGLYQHFKAIAEAVDIPIILYNIPGRSVINMTDETIERLSQIRNIVGIKDATGDLARVCTLRHRVGPDFIQFSGEDMTTVGFNAEGGVGCISVSSNLMPKQCAQVQDACLAEDYAKARELHDILIPLHQVLFIETSPGPVKYAASLMGKASPEVRLPLVQPTDATKQRVRDVLAQLRLI